MGIKYSNNSRARAQKETYSFPVDILDNVTLYTKNI